MRRQIKDREADDPRPPLQHATAAERCSASVRETTRRRRMGSAFLSRNRPAIASNILRLLLEIVEGVPARFDDVLVGPVAAAGAALGVVIGHAPAPVIAATS